MTPDLRTALTRALGSTAYQRMDPAWLCNAIEPIIDAAIADAAVAECARGIRQRKVDVRDALLAAADDLEEMYRSFDSTRSWQRSALVWLRARANNE